MLTVSGLEAGELLRIATLDDYDGVVYSVGGAAGPSASGTFSRVPYTIEPTGRGRQANLSITIDGYSGVWVPDAGLLETIAFGGSRGPELQDSFYYNASSGTAAATAQLESGDSYTLDALIPPRLDDAALAQLVPGSAPLPPLGELPDGVADTLTEYVGGADTPGASLAAMISALKANGYVSHGIGDEPFSRSGHSADRITELLASQPMLGDAEQYAVTAALMARSIGFPARVVMGFIAPEGTAGAGSAAVDITGSDLSAWIEVDTAGDGWVAIDPNPAVREIPEQQAEDPTQISRPQSVVQPPIEDRTATDDPAPPDVTRSDPTEVEPLWLTILLLAARIIGVTAAVLGILVAPFLGVIAAKWGRRRRRRQAGQPVLRVAGGWDEFADTAIDYGYDPLPHATRRELADVVGGPAPAALAADVDRVTFSPEPPSMEQADRIWSVVGELRGTLSEGRTRWERLRAAISLRSFAARRRDRESPDQVIARLLPTLPSPPSLAGGSRGDAGGVLRASADPVSRSSFAPVERVGASDPSPASSQPSASDPMPEDGAGPADGDSEERS